MTISWIVTHVISHKTDRFKELEIIFALFLMLISVFKGLSFQIQTRFRYNENVLSIY